MISRRRFLAAAAVLALPLARPPKKHRTGFGSGPFGSGPFGG
jgi:hypothetical protein